ncbi:TlpA disulfide reductase family protein [Cochleicola gelatinilyticus]|uniref:Thioredoxin domain-containing protein n=1 Tax=Cochleicola gelatinilyticus TaxID=1763537 RepID=A0A167G9D7_9FLAO|nr:TlpA disulfide reductase family protein [Cochleicola gelatinilyticus]OAB77356.1 hypothetical protein ULVI_12705 [Cochleicola gelatinilyticus]
MKRLLLLLTAIALISCNSESDSFSLNGTAEGYEDGTNIMVFKVTDNKTEVIDTLSVTEGSFSGTYPKSETLAIHFLRPEGTQATVLYFPENVDMKATVYKDSVNASYVTGGMQNEGFRNFSQEALELNKKRQANVERFKNARSNQDNEQIAAIQQENLQLVNEDKAFKKKFLEENNNSLFSVMLLSEMLNRKEITPSEANEIVDNFTPRIAATPLASKVKEVLDGLALTDVGGMAPDFSAPTPNGETLALKDALGKYTIIDFWASWCKPCRIENPNVVRVYEKYHDKGLNIISVSLDRPGQKDKWLKAIEDDNMDWYHVSNLQFWQGPIARQYNIRSIPATFLLDETGKIIDKDLRGPALEAKIASLLGQ